MNSYEIREKIKALDAELAYLKDRLILERARERAIIAKARAEELAKEAERLEFTMQTRDA